jgi:glucose-6-phosphate dehydrogenase assembly protein OpcA
MTDAPQTQLLAEPREVDVVAIERELTQLWRAAAEGNAATASAPVMRACSLNLIVVAAEPHQLDETGDMVGEVTVEHPARIFLVAADRDSAAGSLAAWISARCSLPVPGGKQVCCEQITLSAAGEEVKKIPSIITSLLVPDIPTFVLWKSVVRSSDFLLQALSAIANRVIIDSSDAPDPEATLRAWGTYLHQPSVSFGDLAWTHVTPWRAVVANAFNPESMRPLLGEIRKVQIAYSTTMKPVHSGLSQALLLGGWLAQRLRWEVTSPLTSDAARRNTASFRAGTEAARHAVTLAIHPVEARAGFPGGIESIVIGTDGMTLEFSATPHPRCVAVTRRTQSESIQEMVPVIVEKTEAELIAQELEITVRDAGYEAVMDKLLQILGQ